MPKIIEWFNHSSIKTDWKTQYIRYRLGRLKHQYWLWNRKNPTQALVDEYDYSILKNCQPGRTVFFASAGYYLKDIWPKIEVVEMHPVVETFYPGNIYICQNRAQLSNTLPWKVDNFAVVNNRGDIWTELENITEYCKHYTQVMNNGCRFFYSFRDTQIVGVNRLTTDMEKYFLNWAQSLSAIGLELVWNSINFKRMVPDQNGYYDQLENPDTTNGNLKFWFVYKGQHWDIVK
jgi:hypothetical protein